MFFSCFFMPGCVNLPTNMRVFAQNQPLEKISFFFSCVFLNFCLRFFIVFHIIFMFFSCASMPPGMDFCSRGSFKTTSRDHSKQPAKPKPKAKRWRSQETNAKTNTEIRAKTKGKTMKEPKGKTKDKHRDRNRLYVYNIIYI